MEGVPVSSVEARVAAADLFVANLMGKLSSINYTLPRLRRSILPFYSILWGAHALVALGENDYYVCLPTLRSSKLPKGEFVDFTKLARLNRNDSSILAPFSLDTWRSAIVKFKLDSETPLPEWIGVIIHLVGKLIDFPDDLIEFSPRYSCFC